MITRPITRPVTAPIARAVTANVGNIWNPRALFALGEQGVIYDPNDLNSLFQDSAGITPVTAAGQPVGLMLDKRLTALGELVPTPINLMDAAWATVGTLSSVTSNSITNASGAPAGKQLSVLVVGKKYEIIASYTKSDSATVFQILAGAGNPDAPQSTAASGIYRSITTAVSPVIYIRLAGNTTLTLNSLSVRELPGNHATQPTAASRPILRDAPRRIDYDAVDDVLNVTFPSSLGSACTVARSIPGVGAQILTAQTIGTSFADNVDNCGLIIVNRALTAAETANLTRYLNQRAGV